MSDKVTDTFEFINRDALEVKIHKEVGNAFKSAGYKYVYHSELERLIYKIEGGKTSLAFFSIVFEEDSSNDDEEIDCLSEDFDASVWLRFSLIDNFNFKLPDNVYIGESNYTEGIQFNVSRYNNLISYIISSTKLFAL